MAVKPSIRALFLRSHSLAKSHLDREFFDACPKKTSNRLKRIFLRKGLSDKGKFIEERIQSKRQKGFTVVSADVFSSEDIEKLNDLFDFVAMQAKEHGIVYSIDKIDLSKLREIPFESILGKPRSTGQYFLSRLILRELIKRKLFLCRN
jgi:hypothetical protein